MKKELELILRIEEEDFLDHKQLNKVRDIIHEVFGVSINWDNPQAGLTYYGAFGEVTKGEVKK